MWTSARAPSPSGAPSWASPAWYRCTRPPRPRSPAMPAAGTSCGRDRSRRPSSGPGLRRPRLYDLRHSFAVATLASWHAEGADAQARLPALPAYLGHVKPSSTYWYLQAAPELLAAAAARLECFLGDQP